MHGSDLGIHHQPRDLGHTPLKLRDHCARRTAGRIAFGGRSAMATTCDQCDQVHTRCGAHNRAGNPCGRHPYPGATVCKSHGAGNPAVRKNADRRRATAEAVALLDTMGTPIEGDPLDVLLDQVHEAAGNVTFLRTLVQKLEQTYAADGADSAGIAGPDHLGDGARHIYVRMYDEERDRLARMAKLCLDAGIDERRIDLAERYGTQISRVVGAIADWILARVRAGDDVDEIAAALPAEERRALTAVASDAA